MVLGELPKAKFDESVELSISLGVDPRHADQMVRGSVVLPHGTGREIRVLVFAVGEKEVEARQGGADVVGGEELIEKISSGWLEFDKAIATPDMMSKVSKIGKILGPRGLMPNPKIGTVTFDIARAIKEIKGGKVEFKVDKGGNLHILVGKASFDLQRLKENIVSLMEAVNRAKPPASRGTYLKGVYLSTTMGPSLSVDPHSLFE